MTTSTILPLSESARTELERSLTEPIDEFTTEIITELANDDADVRMDAIREIERRRSWLPDHVLSTLREVADNDPDPEVQALADKVAQNWSE